MHKPIEIHQKVARILTYIKGSLGKGLLYKKHEHLQIESFSNSNYVGDKRDRNSTSAYCTYVGGDMVTWSKKQSGVSRSSAKAEYRAMAHTTCEMMWVKSLLWELRFSVDYPMSIYCDNQATI